MLRAGIEPDANFEDREGSVEAAQRPAGLAWGWRLMRMESRGGLVERRLCAIELVAPTQKIGPLTHSQPQAIAPARPRHRPAPLPPHPTHTRHCYRHSPTTSRIDE
jgi:hypothetical protein